MPPEWTQSLVAPIFNWKRDIRDCICYSALKFHVDGMNGVERVFENTF